MKKSRSKNIEGLKNEIGYLLWQAYISGDPDCILTTPQGRREVVDKILNLITGWGGK